MTAKFDNPIVWAGIALRYADGTVVAVEIDHPRGEISVDREVEEDLPLGGFRHYIGGRSYVTASLSGLLSRGWRVGEEAARQHAAQAIATGPAAIEGVDR